MIDQLVASSCGIQHDPMPISQPEIEHQPPPLSHTQVTFASSFANIPEETFTYPASNFSYTYPYNIQINPGSIQMSQNYPDSQIPYHTTFEAFTLMKKFENPELVRSLSLERSFDKTWGVVFG